MGSSVWNFESSRGVSTQLKQAVMTIETDKGKSYQPKRKVLHLDSKENEPYEAIRTHQGTGIRLTESQP